MSARAAEREATTNAPVTSVCLIRWFINFCGVQCGLTKKAEPPPTRGVNRDSGTASANGGWLRRLVRQTAHVSGLQSTEKTLPASSAMPLDDHACNLEMAAKIETCESARMDETQLRVD